MAGRRDAANDHLAQLAMVKGWHAIQVEFEMRDFFVSHDRTPARVFVRQHQCLKPRKVLEFKVSRVFAGVQVVPEHAPHKAKLEQATHTIVSVVLSCRGAARRTLSTPEPRARSQIGASIVSKDGAFLISTRISIDS